MPTFKPISQKNWKRGLVANTPDQDQPPDSLARISNMLYTRRGGLRTCDGSLIISALNGALAPGTGPWTELFLFQPNNVSRYYIGIKKDFTTHLGTPTGLAAADGGAGSLAAGTYFFKVSANDGAGGHTIASAEVSITILVNHKINLTWNTLPNAVTYDVWAAVTVSGTETNLIAGTGLTTNSFTVDAPFNLGLTTPPTLDNTQTCPLIKIPATSYAQPANTLATFPADAINPVDGTPGGTGGGGGTTNPSSGVPPGPQGGTVGNVSPTPMIAQFANKAILALGNGFAPQLVADTTQPDWAATTQYNAASVIKPLTNNAGGFYFIAKNGGVSAGANPVFPQTVGGTVSDGTVTWQNINTPPVVALFNTFTSIYPDWNANVTYSVGDLIRPTANNAGGYIFQCKQGGLSSNAAPTFPQTQGQVVAESSHNVLWLNLGFGNTTPAPRGAAHEEVYAGALWVANTNPTTTTDQLDGPSALRMSDINNPISWNPLNTAFIDRDDGDQVTGLKAMTIAESGIPPTGSLAVFKNFKTFQVNGVFGSSNFSIQRAQTDLGCIASRTIEFCPGFGIIRMTHLGFALFDTTRDRVISEAIRPFLFADPQITDIQTLDWNLAYFSKAAQTADPPMYVCATPIALANLPMVVGGGGTPAGSVNITTVAGNWTSASQTLFIRVTKFTSAGETVLTQEGAVGVVNATLVLRVSMGAGSTIDTTATKFRVYIGQATGAYNSYAEITPAQILAGVNFTSLAAFPNAGTLNVGIGGLSRLFCYDLVQKAWAIIDLPFSISALRQVRPPGSEPITVVGSFNDGTMRRIQAGDTTWDGTPVNWSFRPAELMGLGGTERVFYHRLGIRGVGTAASINSLIVTPNYDGTDDVPQSPVNYTFGSGKFASWSELMMTALTAHVTINGSGVMEIGALDYDVEPLPLGTPPQFA